MSRWWRAYDEAVDDPKLQCLSDESFRFWFNLCCVCSVLSGNIPSEEHLAFKMRMQRRRVVRLLADLRKAGLIDDDDQGSRPHNWHGRQYKSDVSTERVQRHRNGRRNVSVTPPENREQNTEAETDKTSLRSEPAPAKAVRRSSAKIALPPDWQPHAQDFEYAVSRKFLPPQIMRMADAFANHHRAKGGLMADWHAAWRTWVENEIKFQGTRTQGQSNGKRTVHDAARDLHQRIAAFDEPSPSQLLDGTGDDAFRLLPSR